MELVPVTKLAAFSWILLHNVASPVTGSYQYVFRNTKAACKQLGVGAATLRRWDKDGKIKTMRTPGGVRLYDLDSLESERRKFIYARVSSRNQKDDLNSQLEHLKTRYPNHELIEDVGSGLNFKRKGFNALLELVLSGHVSEIVVAHRDRLCRYWAMDCPQRIREHAMSDACNAVKNAKAKYLKTSKIQQVSFRAKRDPIQSFGFDKSSLNQDFVFGSKKFKMEFESSEPFHTDLEGTRIVREGSRYFVIIPQKLPYQVPENQRIDAVALDPGVRTFMSFYSEVLHGKISEGDFQRIYRLCLRLDRLMSKISKAIRSAYV